MEENKEQIIAAFYNEMRALLNKHLSVFTAANSRLEAMDLDGFKTMYQEQDKTSLEEMVKVQHIAYNNLYAEFEARSKQLMQIMKEISLAKTPEEMARLRKKADVTLMAQNMVDSGKSVEEVKKAIKGEQSAIFKNDQRIIVN